MHVGTRFRRNRGVDSRLHVFSFLDSFSEVRRVSGPVFMFCTPRLIFGGTKGVRARFNVLRSRARFRRYRGSRFLFSCFARPDSFSAVPRDLDHVFMFCAQTHFVWYRWRRVPFSAVPRALGPVFMFCTSGLIFGGTEGVWSCFLILPAQTHYRRYRGRQVTFSCFALPDSFSAVPRESGLAFVFYAPKLIFSGSEVGVSRFHVLRSQTSCWRYRGHGVLFSCFALPGTFLAVRRASGVIFMFCAPGLIIGGNEGAGSHFYILRSRSHFPRYRGRPVPFSSFAHPDLFSTILRASGLVFLFCALRLIFGGTQGVGSRFHVLHARTHFRRYRVRRVTFSYFARPDQFQLSRGRHVPFLFLHTRTRFRWYRGRRVPFSCFALPDTFLAVPRASCPVFMFCTP
jgi:hypothetical protein